MRRVGPRGSERGARAPELPRPAREVGGSRGLLSFSLFSLELYISISLIIFALISQQALSVISHSCKATANPWTLTVFLGMRE